MRIGVTARYQCYYGISLCFFGRRKAVDRFNYKTCHHERVVRFVPFGPGLQLVRLTRFLRVLLQRWAVCRLPPWLIGASRM